HEDFDSLEIADGRLDTVRRQILEEAGRNQSLDSAHLKAQLAACGFNDLFAVSKSWGGPDWPWFLRKRAALADVEAWWGDAIARHRKVVSLAAEVRLAMERFGAEGTKEAQDQLINLKRLLEANEIGDAAFDDFGVASGIKASL
ncbi:MAG TPA: hypothetical protein VMU42_03620, partial [Candidatus Sulfotelmatobacter sp.]|nr:hypothetical protein [Candidatus Sulfotelmatobacter sp.]